MSKISFNAPGKPHGERPPTLAALLRLKEGCTWGRAQTLCERGKVSVNGVIEIDAAARPRPGDVIEIDEARPRPKPKTVPIVFEDAHLVVIDKPAGISSVPYEEREIGTAMDAVRDAWRAQGKRATETPLLVVHRIDKDTSGLIAFAKTKPAEKAMGGLFRTHDIERTYICVAHGAVLDTRVESRLVEDRGDGLRGSAKQPRQGKRAVTHVKRLEAMPDTTLLEVKLETGKTHQIRIHLAELGHPLVGERVYVRDYTRRTGDPIASPRLLLHAATLGFVHPITGEKVALSSPLPPAFEAELDALRSRPSAHAKASAKTTEKPVARATSPAPSRSPRAKASARPVPKKPAPAPRRPSPR